MLKSILPFSLGLFALLSTEALQADTLTAKIYSTEGTLLGQVSFEDSRYGLIVKPHLSKLPAGQHGFHIHQHPNCGDKAMKAGEHLDPEKLKTHLGPYTAGHLGDLPLLATDNKGEAHTPTLAPRLTTRDLLNHALIIHAGGDNYSDNPANGGGGTRIACGEIKK